MDYEDDGLAAWAHQESLLQQQYESEQYALIGLPRKKETTMPLIAKDNAGDSRTYETPPAGAYAARCIRVIDLGTQTFKIKDETQIAHQVVITWELAKKMSDGRPYTINEKYTLSINPKSKLNGILEGWRGRAFTSEERAGFELENVMDKVCFLNIVHTNKGARTYANVASAMPIPDGVNVPPRVNELMYFTIAEGAESDLAKIPKFYAEMIRNSPEWQLRGPVASAAQPEQVDDDIPF